MWIVKGMLFLVLLFVLVWFFAANSDQSVDLNVFGRDYLDINIYWVVAFCYLLGFATAFVMGAVRELGFRREIGQLRKTARAKDKEIAELRTLPLRDEPAKAAAKPALAKAAPPVRTEPPEGAAP